MTIDKFINLCAVKINTNEYLKFEKERKDKSGNISGEIWIKLIINQGFKCYYCNTNIEIIQELIFNKIINPRKRGTSSYSGMHFEVDHKNANNNDNNINNLVASCYYCNNDKSNTISSQIFKNYFGPDKGKSFSDLFKTNNFTLTGELRQHFKSNRK